VHRPLPARAPMFVCGGRTSGAAGTSEPGTATTLALESNRFSPRPSPWSPKRCFQDTRDPRAPATAAHPCRALPPDDTDDLARRAMSRDAVADDPGAGPARPALAGRDGRGSARTVRRTGRRAAWAEIQTPSARRRPPPLTTAKGRAVERTELKRAARGRKKKSHASRCQGPVEGARRPRTLLTIARTTIPTPMERTAPAILRKGTA